MGIWNQVPKLKEIWQFQEKDGKNCIFFIKEIRK